MRNFGHTAVDWCCDHVDAFWLRAARMAEAGREAIEIGWQRLCGLLRREPLPRRPLVAVAAAVIVGSALGPWGLTACDATGSAAVVQSVGGWWLLAGLALVAWRGLVAARPVSAAAVLLLAVACLAAGWAAARHRLFASDDLAWQLEAGAAGGPAPVCVEGIVVESPRLLTPPPPDPLRPLSLRPSSECVIAVRAVRAGDAWRQASGRAAVIVDGEPPGITAGSLVSVLGRGLRPQAAANPGEFDFRERARLLRCLSIVRCHGSECIRVVAPPSLFSASALIDRLRAAGVAALRAHISPARSPLAAALLLGSRESLPAEESREFLVTGTIHILSISGLHVGILAFALFGILRAAAVPRGWAIVAVAAITGCYMLLVRAETPVVRATLLVWLTCVGAAIGRRSLAINALAAAAIVVLAWHPPELFRVGTQFSFLSTAVLIGAAAMIRRRPTDDPIERLIEKSRSPFDRWCRRQARGMLDVIVTGAAVWVLTAPLVAMRFHVVSPVGLLLNPLVAPFIPLAMAWGFLCLALAPVSSTLAGLCGGLCDATLWCVSGIVGWAASVPGGHVWVTGPPHWWVAGWYLLLPLVLLCLPIERLTRINTWAAAAAVWIGIGLAGAAALPLLDSQPAPLRVVVAAMGHGCGIVVRSPTGRVLVYDAGRLGAPGAARRGMESVLWSEGVSRIDTLVLSHADTDHFNAVPELLERFAVGEVVVSPAFLRSDSGAVGEVLRRIHARRIPVRPVAAGDEWPCDPLCRVRVLHPAPEEEDCQVEGAPAADNEASLVLAVEAAGRRMLLTGDIEGSAAARFVSADPDSCDVVVAPHHGSITSLPPEVARATRPDWVLVSGIGGSRWHDVRRAYEQASADRAANVVKTGGSDGGAIALEFTAAGVRVEQFSAGRWRPVKLPVRPRRERSSLAASAMPRRP
jgi:competence protein ComEC